MLPLLSSEQQHAIRGANERHPAITVDPTTNRRFVLISEEWFEHFRAFWEEDDAWMQEAYAVLDSAWMPSGACTVAL